MNLNPGKNKMLVKATETFKEFVNERITHDHIICYNNLIEKGDN